MRISSFFIPLRLAGQRLRAEGGGETRSVLLLAGATGIGVGVVAVVVEKATLEWLADPLADQPLWLRAAGPAVGLVVAWAALGVLTRGASPDTADALIRHFHGPTQPPSPSAAMGRTFGGVGTIGYGGALGLDGPAVYLGGMIGATVQHRMARLFSRDETKVLLVAGAAAGFAAVFKTPAAGALFAIELPYRNDLARRVALPAVLAATTAYLVAALVEGAEPLLPLAGDGGFDLVDIGGAVLVGLLCGLGARGFCILLELVTQRAGETATWIRLLTAGTALFGLAYLADGLFDAPLSLGTGYDVISWTADPAHSLWLVLAMLLLRTLAVLATMGGGGVGGLFVPLVVAGALVGRLGGGLPGLAESNLWLVVGMAAFAGAGYRTPFAAVAFVAEATGQPGFLVPAVVATAVAQLLMGPASVSAAQRADRRSRLERRTGLPLSMVVETDVPTAPPDARLDEVVEQHLVGRRQRAVPVVDGDRYLGLVRSGDVARVRRRSWTTTPVADLVDGESPPTAQITWLVGDALDRMEEEDTDLLAVLDSAGRFVGVVTTDAIRRLDEILDRTEGRNRAG